MPSKNERRKSSKQPSDFSNRLKLAAIKTFVSMNFAERTHRVSLSFVFVTILGRIEFAKFTDDKQILLHITKQLFKTSDPEELICSNTVSVNKENLDAMSDHQVKEVFDDVYAFCCSFVDKVDTNASPISQCAIDFVCL